MRSQRGEESGRVYTTVSAMGWRREDYNDEDEGAEASIRIGKALGVEMLWQRRKTVCESLATKRSCDIAHVHFDRESSYYSLHASSPFCLDFLLTRLQMARLYQSQYITQKK